MAWPVTPGTSRHVLWRILLAGTPLTGCESIDIQKTNHRKASTVHASFALKADPSALATWADQDKLGYAGRIVPINPTRTEVMGVAAYPRVQDAPGPIDHAFIMVPAASVPDAVAG